MPINISELITKFEIRNLDDKELSIVLEVYNTVFSQNPTKMFDEEGMLRDIVRQFGKEPYKIHHNNMYGTLEIEIYVNR
jgi:xanthine dehydrogenase molybdopterin-binding subunit B